MKKSDFVNELAEKTSLSKSDAEKAYRAFIEITESHVSKGEDVPMTGFGTFKQVSRAARKCRNPKTGEAVEVPAKKTVKFKVSKSTKKESES